MKVFNEKDELVQIDQLVVDLSNIDRVPVLSEEEIENELESYFQQANQLQMRSLGMDDAQSEQFAAMYTTAGISGWGKKVWKKIKKILCAVLNEGSTAAEIIKAVLEAIIGVIPGGIIIKKIVEKIVAYVLSLGYQRLCPA